MSQFARQNRSTGAIVSTQARPVVSASAALTTLILSVLLGLLCGAAWMQLT